MSSNRTKILSCLIVFSMLFQIVPIKELTTVSAKENLSEQVKKISKEEEQQNVRKEIIEKRTENSKTFINPDGTFRAEISQKPIHYRTKGDKWETIDNELVANRTDKVFENKANAFKAKFNQKHIPNTPFLEIEDAQGSVDLQIEPLEHTAEKPAIVEGIVDGESITYPEVFSNIDIKYTVGSDRVKEDIIYSEKPKDGFPERFTYKIDLKGMNVKEKDGTLYLYNEQSNTPLYYFDAPYMYDSYKPKGFQTVKEIESIPEEAVSYDIQLKHEVIDNKLYLHVVPNKTWLEDPSRIYPITIDPTLVKLQSTAFVEDTNIRSGFPTQTGGNDLELAGGRSGTNVIRGLLKFDLSSIPAATTIMDANMNLWYSSTNNNTPINISVHRVTKGWEEIQATWNQPKTATPWTVKGGDFVSTPLSTVFGIGPVEDLAIAEKRWDIPTTLISSWITNPQNNYGLLLKSTTEDVNTYKKFIASEHSIDSQYHPLLVVTYKTTARLGLENYWEYDSHPLIGGASFTNLTTGNNVIQYQDFNLLARGEYGFNFTRTYNSKSLEKSIFGYGWTASGLENLFIDENKNTIDYMDEDGTTHTFTYDANKDLYLSGPGLYLTIRKYSIMANGRYDHFYELIDKYGEKNVFKRNKVDFNTNMQTASLAYMEDRHGNRITFNYDANNRLLQIASQLSTNLVKSIDFTYNAAGFVSKITFEDNELKFEYDQSGKVTTVDQKKSDGKYTSTIFEYKNNRISAVVDPNNRRTDYTYENEMLVKVQEPDIHQTFDGANRPGTKYSLDTLNKISVVSDPKGNETTYYSNDNYVTTRLLAGGIETQYELDPNYNVLKESTDGLITTNTYDPNGNLLTTTDPEGNKQTYTYTTYSNVKTTTDSDGKTTTFTYYPKGDLEKIEIPDSNAADGKLVTLFTYDAFGDLESITQPDGAKHLITIDYAGSTKTVENIDSYKNKTTTITNLQGNLLKSIDGKGRIFAYVYNAKNELEKVIDPKGKVTSYEYDNNGNIKSVNNTLNFASAFIYNGQNQLKEETNGIGKRITYDYDDNGNLTDIHLPNNGTIHNKYDELNRLTEMYSNGLLKWKYNYEGVKIASINQGTKLYKSFDYYDNHYLKSVREGLNLLEYTYLGKEYNSEIKYTVEGKKPTVLEYIPDDVYRTKEINKNNEHIVSFHFNKDGWPEGIFYANGSSISMQFSNSRLVDYTLKNNASQEFDTYMFDYDVNHNINKIISNAGVAEYDYDELDQLRTEKLPDGTKLTYVYDDVGNRKQKNITQAGRTTTTKYEYNGANQLIKVDNQDYQYDSNGNLKSDGTRTYIFNNFNQLEEIKDSTGKIIASYTYDEDGKRKSTNVSGKTINYYYDGLQVLYETDGNNSILREYTYDDNGHPLTMTINGETYYYLVNHHGDVMALTDSRGNVVASYTYDAWGNILTQIGEMAEINPYRYASYRYDENTKLYYLIARYYNPDTGVFLSLDPVRGEMIDPITMHGYIYADNNPVMNVDPDGERGNLIKILISKIAPKVGKKGKSKGKGNISAKDIVFSDKFKKSAYKNQVQQRGWNNESIAKTINNPYKTDKSVNKHTGNSVTVYFKDKTHYVAVDNGTGKVIQVSNLNKADWKFDPTFSK